MTWWNAALHWLAGVTQFCLSGLTKEPDGKPKLKYPPTDFGPKLQQGVLFSRDDLIRPGDTRARCSVCLILSVSAYQQRLTHLLKHHGVTSRSS